MKKGLVFQAILLVFILGFSGTTYPVKMEYNGSGSGLGDGSEKSFKVLRLHDFLHIEGSITGLMSITITESKTNATIYRIDNFGGETDINDWIKVNTTINVTYDLNYVYLGSYEYSFTINAVGGFWR